MLPTSDSGVNPVGSPFHHEPEASTLTGFIPKQHQVNLAGDPRYADKLAEMEMLLLAEMRRLDDPWRLWNQPDDGLTPPPEDTPYGQIKRAKKRK